MKKFPKRTKYFLDQFMNAANKQNLHPLDWERYYMFIKAAHAGHANIMGGDLIKTLVLNGFLEDDAEYLTSIYSHGRKLLALRKSVFYYYNPKK